MKDLKNERFSATVYIPVANENSYEDNEIMIDYIVERIQAEMVRDYHNIKIECDINEEFIAKYGDTVLFEPSFEEPDELHDIENRIFELRDKLLGQCNDDPSIYSLFI